MYKYKLQKYSGPSSRHECPRCHDRHSLALYVDEAGQPIDRTVGRCNHEAGCGYHYTPKQWAQAHKGWQPQQATTWKPRQPQQQPPALPKPSYIPGKWVIKKASYNSTFVEFLCGILSKQQIIDVVDNYGIGCTKAREVIFWQIDSRGGVRTGKIMQYNPETGHRIKERNADWVHSRMLKEGVLKGPYELRQCLFGEHLITFYPDKPVAIVEAEKTAVICSAIYPKYVWMATGGLCQLSPAKMAALKGKDVVLFPDTDPKGKTFAIWCEKAKEFRGVLGSCRVSDVLERKATAQQKERKIDIADWLIGALIHQRMEELAKSVKPYNRLI